jgi:RNAse P Rpr2/Rpp21/SNM1 subunit domain
MDVQKRGQGPTRRTMKYQDAASHLLLTTCPAISAYLQQEVTEAAIKSKIDMPDSRKHQICEACGYIAVPQTMSTLTMNSSRKRNRLKFSPSSDSQSIVTKCKICDVPAKSWVEASKRHDFSVGVRLLSRYNPATGIKTLAIEKSKEAPDGTKLSRKDRSVKRKLEMSLQARLQSHAHTAQKQAGFGLSLMDLMKSAK